MNTILIANPKGGSGKTTLSTNLAGYFAHQGRHVALSDMDRQRSATGWLERRPEHLPLIHGMDGRGKHSDSLSAEWTIIDSPAGLHGDKLSDAVKRADRVIVPMQPSAFDIGATEDFLQILREEKAVRKERTFVAMVGMRVDSRTRTAVRMQEFLANAGFPVMTNLRDGQVYMQAAELGLSLFDMRPSLVNRDLLQWNPLLQWLTKA
ncbi:ParA family protein [Pseudomethylobacillus aquaticus]|uniref:ParA family protein n=1 Tax=Pseudomethylobacillus aquaticus TaxID=2676064 RepID=A0A3N0V155_9PROT|nr:ParA family protein [Pseudomethylobacillus aquaticus]ROH86208.1 ParA family protein [Pseudomethylobacillus aquaticus]